MFTGIIQAMGRLRESRQMGEDRRLRIDTDGLDMTAVRIGDSIAVNGSPSVSALFATALADGTVLGGDGAEYTSIQTALSNSDVAIVGPGTFNESVSMQADGQSIIGVGNNSNIDGGTSAPAIDIGNNDECLITGVKVQTTAGGGNNNAAIQLGNANKTQVNDVLVRASDADGINNSEGDDCVFRGCRFFDSSIDGTSIVLESNTARCVVDSNALNTGSVTDNGTSNVVGDNS